MKIVDYIEDELPDWALSYAINGDASGIEEEDAAECDAWLESITERLSRRYPGLSVDLIIHDEAEAGFSTAPAFGLACNTVPCVVAVWADDENPLSRVALPWEDEDEDGDS